MTNFMINVFTDCIDVIYIKCIDKLKAAVKPVK